MKRITNKKGFTLVELLIVIAILAILAVLALNLLGNIIQNARIKADMSAASQLKTFIQTYITESEDANLYNVTEAEGSGPDTPYDIIEGFKTAIEADDPYISGTTREYGPYIDDNNQFLPAWNPDRGGKHIGWYITIDTGSNSVSVEPLNVDSEDYGEGYTVDDYNVEVLGDIIWE